MSNGYTRINSSMQASMGERSPIFRARIMKWNSEPVVTRVANPTNPARARSVGYKALKGIFVVRVRVAKGRRIRPKAPLGRKSGKNQKRVSPSKSAQWTAGQKALRKFINASILGSYFVGNSGTDSYYEIVLKVKG